MSHPFGDKIRQHLARKHGLNQAKLAEGIGQQPSVITKMCQGKRLNGSQSRERVIDIIKWFYDQEVLSTRAEADALLEEAGMARLGRGQARGEERLIHVLKEIDPSPDATKLVRSPQPAGTLRVFLCHSSGDKEAVRAMHRQLKANGYVPWLDEEELLGGQDWDQEIRKAVRTSDVVIACLSHWAVTKAGYVQKELRLALDVADEQPDGTIFLIPVKLEECEVPDRLRKWQWINLFEERGWEQLFRALKVRAGNTTQRTKANFKGPFGTKFEGEASNHPPTIQPAIRVKDATSREGGVLADDRTGRGIDAEQLDARDDVLLTSAPPKPDQDPKV